MAARLTPTEYPFEVTKVTYRLFGLNSFGRLDHRFQVFASSATPPPATPTNEVTVEVASSSIEEPSGLVSHELKNSILVYEGEHVYVAIQNASDGVKENSYLLCDDGKREYNNNWWSNAGAPPFPWATLASFNILGDLSVEVWGFAAD